MTLRTRAMTVHVRQLNIAGQMDDSARLHVDRLISIDDRATSVVARCTRACTHPQRAPSGVTEQRERKGASAVSRGRVSLRSADLHARLISGAS